MDLQKATLIFAKGLKLLIGNIFLDSETFTGWFYETVSGIRK